MILSDFHTRISQAIRRGTSLDSVIPAWVAESANVLEMNYTFSWMRRTASATLETGADVPNQIAMPNSRVKSIDWIRPVLSAQDDGTEYYGDKLLGVDPDRVTAITLGVISGFYIDGLDYIYFDAVPTEDTDFRIRYAEYTDWPSDTSASPALLLRGHAVLAAETLLLYAQEMRDLRMAELYSARRDRLLEMLLKSEEELKWDHQNDLVMRADVR